MRTEREALLVKLQKTELADGVYVHSKDVPGLHLFGDNIDDMKPTIEAAIRRLLKANEGIEVEEIIWLQSKPARNGSLARRRPRRAVGLAVLSAAA